MIRCVYIFIILTTLFLSGCSSSEKHDPGTPEGLYKLAQSLREDSRFEEALSYLSQLKNKFQYSRYAVAAELDIANINFEREAWLEAESAYKLFKEFHPTHKQIDYVTFRLAMTYFKQLPDTFDRDLSLANKALLYFEEVYTSYPSSDYAGSARDHHRLTQRMLGKKELYAADYYFIRDQYDSALRRYEALLKLYPGLGLNKRALFGATISAHETKNKSKAQQYLSMLEKKYGGSKEYKDAKSKINED